MFRSGSVGYPRFDVTGGWGYHIIDVICLSRWVVLLCEGISKNCLIVGKAHDGAI